MKKYVNKNCGMSHVEIRSKHPAAFRSGEWAWVASLVWRDGRVCYYVVFDDGATDYWVIDDPAAQYEFRAFERIVELSAVPLAQIAKQG